MTLGSCGPGSVRHFEGLTLRDAADAHVGGANGISYDGSVEAPPSPDDDHEMRLYTTIVGAFHMRR